MFQNLTLPRLLGLDALTCGGFGLLLLAASGPIGALTGLPGGLLFWVGLALLPVAGFMAWAARQASPPAWATALVVWGNLGWVVASVAVLFVYGNPLGVAFVLAQAAAVAVLALLEWRASRAAPLAA